MRTKAGKLSGAKNIALKYIDLYKKDNGFHAEFGLYAGLITSFAYAAFLAVCGYAQGSPWLGSLAGYNFSLVLIRMILTKGLRKSTKLGAWKASLYCGVMLLLLTATLYGIGVLTILYGNASSYPHYLIYGVAAYTFYKVITSVRSLIIYRRIKNPIYTASMVLNLSAAMVSLYLLQSALLSAFGDNENFRQMMGIILGSSIGALIAAESVYMIVIAAVNICIIRKSEHD